MRLWTLPLWTALGLLCSGCSEGRAVRPVPAPALGTAQLEVGPVALDVRLAMTQAQRARGLSGVASLGPSEGMLFVYPDEQRRKFWMRDCLVALDIAFLDAAGRVLHVDTLPPPRPQATVPQTRRSEPSAYVLEVPAGFFERHGLGAGSQVKIPARVRREDAE